MDAKDAEIRSASRQEQGHQRRYIFSLHLSVIHVFPKNSSLFEIRDIFEICFNWWRKAISLKIPHIKWASGWREMQEKEEKEEVEEKGLSYPDFPPSAESRRRRRRGGGLYDR